MLHSDEEPISYYRVIQELNENLDLENSIVTHDAGAPQPSASWLCCCQGRAAWL